MAFKLPKLLAWVDVPPYEGMQVEAWLNPTVEEYQPPAGVREPWDTEMFWQYGRVFQRLRVPAELTDDGEEMVIGLGSEQAVYDLWRMPGFDQAILPRALAAWSEQRHALLDEALKN